MVIELFINRLEGPGDVGEVHDPARLLLHLPGHAYLDPEGMAVQPATFVIFRNIRQKMCRFNGEYLEYFHGNKPVLKMTGQV